MPIITTNDKLRIAVVGAGAIVKRGHLPVLKQLDLNYEIVGICDPDIKSLKAVANEFNIKNIYTSLEELISNTKPDVLDIATPTPTHYELILKSAETNVKNIIVEKPLAFCVEEAREISEIVLKRNIFLTIIQNYRYFPEVIKVRNLIVNEKRIGKLLAVNGNAYSKFPSSWTKSLWLYQSEGAVLYDFFPHMIDLALWITDATPESVFAHGGDITSGNMKFINYAQGIVSCKNSNDEKFSICMNTSWMSGTQLFTLEFIGTGGYIYLDVRNNLSWEVHGVATPFEDFEQAALKLLSKTWGIISGSLFRGALENYKRIFLEIFNYLRRNRGEPVTVKDGLKTNLIIDAYCKSMIQKQIIPINIEK